MNAMLMEPFFHLYREGAFPGTGQSIEPKDQSLMPQKQFLLVTGNEAVRYGMEIGIFHESVDLSI